MSNNEGIGLCVSVSNSAVWFQIDKDYRSCRGIEVNIRNMHTDEYFYFCLTPDELVEMARMFDIVRREIDRNAKQ